MAPRIDAHALFISRRLIVGHAVDSALVSEATEALVSQTTMAAYDFSRLMLAAAVSLAAQIFLNARALIFQVVCVALFAIYAPPMGVAAPSPRDFMLQDDESPLQMLQDVTPNATRKVSERANA